MGVNYLRKRQRQERHGLAEHLNEWNDFEISQSPEQESNLLRGEEKRIILSELEKLNSKQRLAVTLRYFERLPQPVKKQGAIW